MLIYLIPGIIVVGGAIAYHFFKDRMIEILLYLISISLYLIGFSRVLVEVMRQFRGFKSGVFLDLNFKTFIFVGIFSILASIFLLVAKRLTSKRTKDIAEKKKDME